jgi:hypothetical protein
MTVSLAWNTLYKVCYGCYININLKLLFFFFPPSPLLKNKQKVHKGASFTGPLTVQTLMRVRRARET